MNVFFHEETFCLHWSNSWTEKYGDVGGSWKFKIQQQSSTLKYVLLAALKVGF